MATPHSTIDLSDLLSRLRRQGHNTEHLERLDGPVDECYMCSMGQAIVAIESISRANANFQSLGQRCDTLLKFLHGHASTLPQGPEREAWKFCADMLQGLLEAAPGHAVAMRELAEEDARRAAISPLSDAEVSTMADNIARTIRVSMSFPRSWDDLEAVLKRVVNLAQWGTIQRLRKRLAIRPRISEGMGLSENLIVMPKKDVGSAHRPRYEMTHVSIDGRWVRLDDVPLCDCSPHCGMCRNCLEAKSNTAEGC